ncbi:MAG: hypothetical protein JWR03_1619 [Cohnella sp.]|nr:hypothetical protein [Cohnella sp.]
MKPLTGNGGAFQFVLILVNRYEGLGLTKGRHRRHIQGHHGNLHEIGI